MQSATEDAQRGFVAAPPFSEIRAAGGTVVHDAAAFDFLAGPAPDTVDPTLWEHGARVARHGLFEVCEGIYQVRGIDLANLTVVESETGIIVIDVLTCTETAKAALELYRSVRGDRPTRGVVITHPHADHFGGIDGVVTAEDDVPVVVPEGFVEHAVSENLLLGPAMGRRSAYMYGAALPTSPTGNVGCGLGQRLARGQMGLPRPTIEITRTGETLEIDGVVLEMQLTPGTEAPAEMNIMIPGRRALCVAENAVHSLHNIVTLRGAQVRDARAWAHYLSETLRLFGDRADVVLATHHWPTWGNERVRRFLADQRDVYAYIHDQTVRLINHGLTPREVAETLKLPPPLADSPAGQELYGSLNHNVKGVYQRYLGWYDANPAHLWPLPPEEEGRHWMRLVGGPDAAVAAGRDLMATGDLRFAATLLDHAVFADPEHAGARELLAEVYTRLGRGSRNATWRNCYLTGAQELLDGPPTGPRGPSQLAALVDADDLLDVLTVRVDGPASWEVSAEFDWSLGDGRVRRLRLHHGVLTHEAPANEMTPANTVLHADLTAFARLLQTRDAQGVVIEGNVRAVMAVLGSLERAPTPFAVVEP